MCKDVEQIQGGELCDVCSEGGVLQLHAELRQDGSILVFLFLYI